VTHWYSYWLAVSDQFAKRGHQVPALDVALNGDVPLGAGLSSSAAFEVCAATLLNHVCRAGLSPKEIALLAQAAEHSDYVGVRCGIMDQFASALGAEAQALFVDCHTLDYETVPFDPTGAVIVIINTNKPRELRSSDYNRRREQCEEGLRLLNEAEGASFETLRHVPREAFDRHSAALPEKVRQRVKHNLDENDRVRAFVKALKASNWSAAGEALYASHASLRDDYEVSCTELDAIVAIARESGLAHGCRMTGGGFGGCAVALVPPQNVEQFIALMEPEYQARTGLKATVYATRPMEGASVAEV
jgi:galactokinase